MSKASSTKTKPSDGRVISTAGRPKPSKHPNDILDRFVIPPVVGIPDVSPPWGDLLAAVDRTRPCPSEQESWGFWVPDLHVMASGNNARQDRQLQNWCAIRPAWLWSLQRDVYVRNPQLLPMRGRDWRQVLMADPTHGAGTFAAPDGSRQPSKLELDLGKTQGKTFTEYFSRTL